MFKLLIVDDQKPVREGLRKSIKWDELGFEVIGEAGSAEKALEIIESTPVDVLLTDIVMAEMNGLKLIKEIKGINPYIKAVILSGYNEFQYAKEAVRLGVYDFLTKPVAFQELHRVFSEIKILLESEEQSKRSLNVVNDIKKEKILNSLAKGYIAKLDEIYGEAENLGLNFSGKPFCVVRLRMLKPVARKGNIELFLDDIQSLKVKITERVQETLQGDVVYYSFDNDIKEISFLLCLKDKYYNIENNLSRLEIFGQNECIVHIGIGNQYDEVEDIQKSYVEAGKALENSAIHEDNHIQKYSAISEQFSAKTSIINEKIKDEILYFLAQSDKTGLIGFIENIVCDQINSENASIKGFLETCTEILLIINKFVYNASENRKPSNEFSVNIKEIYEKDNVSEIKSFLMNAVDYSFIILKEHRENTSGLMIESVKKYISQHCAEDISLIKLADIFYVHHTHLSRLFKEKTGENFIDYLTRVRIENAKTLLADFSLKIYDIAEMVGYESPKYFSKTFKDYVGLSPAEFRNKMS